jgi:hypothetical protein
VGKDTVFMRKPKYKIGEVFFFNNIQIRYIVVNIGSERCGGIIYTLESMYAPTQQFFNIGEGYIDGSGTSLGTDLEWIEILYG